MTTNKHLRELAEGVKHWGNSVADAWPADPDFNDSWVAGAIDEDGNKYPVIEVDADQYDAPGDSERLARFFTAANPATVLTLLDEIETLQGRCGKLVSALRRISYRASGYECRQAPTSDLQRAFSDLMKQADDALYCFYNEGIPRQRNCEYAGCCEPAVDEALCAVHLEDWREQQASDAVTQKGKP